MGMPPQVANATNSVGLWPGALSGALGFKNLFHKTGHHLKTLFIPTVLGAILGSWLLIVTSQRAFEIAIPFLIAAAATLLLVQPRIKEWMGEKEKEKEKLQLAEGESAPINLRDAATATVTATPTATSPSPATPTATATASLLQFFVALYGGYFGAGMGIMMLAAFALYMEGNTHELNAVKNWLGLVINFTASVVFIAKGFALLGPALVVAAGSIIGGYAAARISQRFDPAKLRLLIAIYGLAMAAYFAYRAFA